MERHLDFIFKKDHLCFWATLAGNQMKSTTEASNPVCPLGIISPNPFFFNKSEILIDSFHLQGLFILTKLMETVARLCMINRAVTLTYQRSMSCRYGADDQSVTSQRVLGQLGVRWVVVV